MTGALVLDGQALTIADVVAVAYGRPVLLGDAARARMHASRALVETIAARGDVVYGLTTGVGPLKRVPVHADEQPAFNRALILAHCVGSGPPAPDPVVRAAMLVRAEGLSLAGAGVRPEVVDALCAALNAGLAPQVHTVGSVGQSDLAPLADIARHLIGAHDDGADLRALGLTPLVLEAREALAMVNANAFSFGWACLALSRAAQLIDALDEAAALTMEGMLANASPLHPAVSKARPLPGLRTSLLHLRALLDGGELLDGKVARELQDPLSLRTVPQLHGAVRDALAHASALLESELWSAADNPLVVLDEDIAISTGNFDGTGMTAALDHVRLVLAAALTAGGERVQKLLSEPFSGLPTGLRRDDDSPGDALAIYSQGVAGLVAEGRLLARPVSLELATSSVAEGIEDRISLGPVAARYLDEMASLGRRSAAIELVCAAQAVDLRDRVSRLGPGVAAVYALVRTHVGFTEVGRPLPPGIDALVEALPLG